MVDAIALKGKIRGNNLTQQECANALKLSLTGFNLKINGTHKFNVDEAAKLTEILHLSSEEACNIFLS